MQYLWRRGTAGMVCVIVASAGLVECTTIAREQLSEGAMPPILNPVSPLNQCLRDLPPPQARVVVAVYCYSDQTGQMKASDNLQTLSKAVTQGATSVLVKALQDTGNGSWFTVVERERLDNLLKERRIVAEMRKTYLGEEAINPQALPALLFAGILLEGGIIGYDTNMQTGGVGAALLGIGAHVKYRLDTVTIYLRAISTKTGQVLVSVTTHKTIASVGVSGNVFRYIAIDKILESEAGFTSNEPQQLAVQQAIEKAVYALVMEGADRRLWSFSSKAAQAKMISDYRRQQFASPAGAQAYAANVEASTAVLAANEAKAKVAAQAQQEKMRAAAEKAAAAGTPATATDKSAPGKVAPPVKPAAEKLAPGKAPPAGNPPADKPAAPAASHNTGASLKPGGAPLDDPFDGPQTTISVPSTLVR